MRASLVLLTVVALCVPARSEGPAPKAGKEMAQVLAALDQALGLESYPPPRCLKWDSGHPITREETQACADKAIAGGSFPELGKSYVVAVLMSAVGPQTLLAIALDAPGWAVLSCD